MKKILTSFLLFATTVLSFAQSIHILHDNKDVTGKTITIPIYKDHDFSTDLSLQNITSAKIDYQVNRTILNPPLDPCSSILFCSGTQCYPPSEEITWTPKDAGSFIYANTIIPSDPGTYGILAHYIVCETACNDLKVLYRVYRTTAGTKDTAYLTINYSCSVGITEENLSLGKLSDAYPNPATADFSLAYAVPALSKSTLEVYNIVGKKVIEIPLQKNEGSITVNTSFLAPGVYFYSLVVNNQRAQTKRLIIRE